MKHPLFLPALTVLFFASCKQNPPTSVPGLTDQNATVIAMDEAGQLIDFVHITPESDIIRIEFLAPTDGSQIQVTAVGPNIHEALPAGFVATSRTRAGFLGQVTVDVDAGIVTSLQGNGIRMGSPPPSDLLASVSVKISAGGHTHPATTIIVPADRFRAALVGHADGNLLPPNPTEAEQEFLDTVIPAIRAKDFDALSECVHRAGDAPDTVTPFLKTILTEDMTSYCFVQVDPNHPDNQDLVEADESLPIQWLLEIGIGDDESGASLEIGQHNGRLMFTN